MPPTSLFLQTINYEKLRELGVDHRLLTLLWLYRSGRKNAAKSLFTNQAHFEVFKHLKNKPSAIYLTDKYLILTFTNRVKVRHRSIREGKSYYVIGINSDNKLFINKMERFYDPEALPINGLVYFSNNQEVYRHLGYEYDLETDSDKTIPKPEHANDFLEHYRVQGDLVFAVVVRENNFEATYLNAIKANIDLQLERALANFILRKIQNALAEVGISSHLADNELIIPAIPVARRWDIGEDLRQTLQNVIEKTVDLTAAGFSISNAQHDIAIMVNRGRGLFGVPYLPLEVTVSFSPAFLNEVADQIVKSLDIQIKERSITFGRHKITYMGFPNRFNFVYEFPYVEEGNEKFKVLFEVRMREIFAAEGKIRIEHVEHGLVEYTIAKPIEIIVENTEIDRFFEGRLNYHTLKLFRKKPLPVN
jgi:hypothetical protein